MLNKSINKVDLMDLDVVLSIKTRADGADKASVESFGEKNVVDPELFLRVLSKKNANGFLNRDESKSPISDHTYRHSEKGDKECIKSLVAETRGAKDFSGTSSHASGKDKRVANAFDTQDPVMGELILAQQNTGSVNLLEDECVSRDSASSKGIGESGCLVHGGGFNTVLGGVLDHGNILNTNGSFKKPSLVKMDNHTVDGNLLGHRYVDTDEQPVLVSRHPSSVANREISVVSDDVHGDDNYVYNKLMVSHLKTEDKPLVVNTSIQSFLSDAAKFDSDVSNDDSDLELLDLFNFSTKTFSSSNVVSDSVVRSVVDISKFNSFLIDEIKTTRELGELKREMTVNIRPSMFGDVAITITNGADGCLISLVTTSQSATNYLSLLKRGIEKSSGAKVSIGSTLVDSKGNLSVVDLNIGKRHNKHKSK